MFSRTLVATRPVETAGCRDGVAAGCRRLGHRTGAGARGPSRLNTRRPFNEELFGEMYPWTKRRNGARKKDRLGGNTSQKSHPVLGIWAVPPIEGCRQICLHSERLPGSSSVASATTLGLTSSFFLASHQKPWANCDRFLKRTMAAKNETHWLTSSQTRAPGLPRLPLACAPARSGSAPFTFFGRGWGGGVGEGGLREVWSGFGWGGLGEGGLTGGWPFFGKPLPSFKRS